MRGSHSRLAFPTLVLIGFLGMAAAGCVERKTSSIAGTSAGGVSIVSLSASIDTVYLDEQSIIKAVVDNPESQELSFNWQAYRGAVNGEGTEVAYFGSYCCAGTDWVVLTVTTAAGEKISDFVVLHVIPEVK